MNKYTITLRARDNHNVIARREVLAATRDDDRVETTINELHREMFNWELHSDQFIDRPLEVHVKEEKV